MTYNDFARGIKNLGFHQLYCTKIPIAKFTHARDNMAVPI